MKKGRIFYGWWIVVVTFIANFMSNGMSFYGWNAILPELCRLNNWSRTAVNIAPSLSALGVLAQPFFSRMVLKFGPRRMMLGSVFFSCASYALMARSHSLGLFYAMAAVLYIANVGINGLVPNTAVSNWFERYRGKALGISTSGISLSGAIIPLLLFFLLRHFSLGQATLLNALLSWVLVFSAAVVLMKDHPEEHGMFVDGLEPDAAPVLQSERKVEPCDLSNRELFRSRAFWNIGLAYGLMLPGVVGVMSQLAPRFKDIGFSGQRAMVMMSFAALVGAAGKVLWGWLCDKFDSRKVVSLSILCQLAGLLVLISSRSEGVLAMFIVLFGLGMGGVMSTLPVVAADFFGRNNFAKAYGYIALFLVFQSSGYLMMGGSFDLFGTYNYAYLGFIIFYLIALVLMLTARHPGEISGTGLRHNITS